MEVLKADVLQYDDWDLRSPTAMNAKADNYAAAQDDNWVEGPCAAHLPARYS